MVINSKTINIILYITTIFMLVCQFLVNDLGLPSYIMVVMDLAILIGFVLYLKNFPLWIKRTRMLMPLLVFAALYGAAVFGMLWHGSSIFSFFNGFRLTARYFILFFVGAFTLDQDRITSLFKMLRVFLWINVFVCTLQYFVLGFKGDFCGGLFGTGLVNSYTNIFLCLLSTYAIALYIFKKSNIKTLALTLIPCVYISALAEIKFYYFELAIIFVLAIVLSKPSKKKIALGGVGILLLLALSWLVDVLWSAGSSDMFTLEGIQFYLSEKSYGYSSSGDWGRIGGIEKANAMFFRDDLNMLGFGLGSCNYGTSFYYVYGYLHYIWFSYQHIYLEQGWVGIVLYIAFFVTVFLCSRRLRRRMEYEDPMADVMFLITECMAVIGLILMFYNTTVTNYPAYFLFLSLSFSFAVYAKRGQEKEIVEQRAQETAEQQ